MSEAAVAMPAASPDVQKQVLGVTDGKMAMWIFLGSDGMSFMGLIATYIALRIGNTGIWPSPGKHLGITLTAINTFVLICSSVSMVKAFEGAVENDVHKLKRYLLLTILGGVAFLGGQAYEYTHFLTGAEHQMTLRGVYHWDAAEGIWTMLPGSGLFAGTFYVLTSFHGCHVLSGVIYLTCVLAGVMRGRWTVNRIEILGLYWHFVDLVWIVIFTIVYLVETSPPVA